MNPLLLLRIGLPVALLALIAWLWFGWAAADNRADRLSNDLQVQTARAVAAEKRETAMKKAEAERAVDGAQIDAMKEELTDAIKSVPAGTAPSAATVAAGCIRLRRAGLTASTDYKRVCGGR